MRQSMYQAVVGAPTDMVKLGVTGRICNCRFDLLLYMYFTVFGRAAHRPIYLENCGLYTLVCITVLTYVTLADSRPQHTEGASESR